MTGSNTGDQAMRATETTMVEMDAVRTMVADAEYAEVLEAATSTMIQGAIDYWTDYRTKLRREALLSQPGTPSREDRLAECDRITRRLQDLYTRLDAMTD